MEHARHAQRGLLLLPLLRGGAWVGVGLDSPTPTNSPSSPPRRPQAAMCRAFTADELPLLRDVGGVIDFDGEPGARGDPNRYRGTGRARGRRSSSTHLYCLHPPRLHPPHHHPCRRPHHRPPHHRRPRRRLASLCSCSPIWAAQTSISPPSRALGRMSPSCGRHGVCG